MKEMTRQHEWNSEFCSCGQDSVTCQIGGERVCGNLTKWIQNLGNVCYIHNNVRNPDTILELIRRMGHRSTIEVTK